MFRVMLQLVPGLVLGLRLRLSEAEAVDGAEVDAEADAAAEAEVGVEAEVGAGVDVLPAELRPGGELFGR